VERDRHLNLLALSDRIEVYVARKAREWVEVNFVDEGWERCPKTIERYDGSLACLAEDFLKGASIY
jgi:hypothetical protein